MLANTLTSIAVCQSFKESSGEDYYIAAWMCLFYIFRIFDNPNWFQKLKSHCVFYFSCTESRRLRLTRFLYLYGLIRFVNWLCWELGFLFNGDWRRNPNSWWGKRGSITAAQSQKRYSCFVLGVPPDFPGLWGCSEFGKHHQHCMWSSCTDISFVMFLQFQFLIEVFCLVHFLGRRFGHYFVGDTVCIVCSVFGGGFVGGEEAGNEVCFGSWDNWVLAVYSSKFGAFLVRLWFLCISALKLNHHLVNFSDLIVCCFCVLIVGLWSK